MEDHQRKLRGDVEVGTGFKRALGIGDALGALEIGESLGGGGLDAEEDADKAEIFQAAKHFAGSRRRGGT